MSVIKKLQSFKKDFDERLFKFLDQKEKEAKKIDPSRPEDNGPLAHNVDLIKEVKRLVLSGGKRLRPAFVFYGYKAAGGKDFKKVWPACLAVELIHIFCLVHDDIMDSSKLRRGKPSTWKLFGTNEAILIGDLAFALAEEIFSKVRPRVWTRPDPIQNYWQRLKFEVIGGQYLDIKKLGGGFKEKDIMKIMDLKSGRYTVVRPLQIGTAIAGADEKTQQRLFKYGVSLGIAFQIQDDILGMFGEEKTAGKPADSDLKEGKKTLLVVKLRERILGCKNARILGKFERIFGNKKLTKIDLQWTRQLMIKLQVLDYCQNKAEQLIKKAKKSLAGVRLEKESKRFLLEIADYMLERRY